MKKNWSSCSPQQVLTLCVTIAAYDPEELRGMQILVCGERERESGRREGEGIMYM